MTEAIPLPRLGLHDGVHEPTYHQDPFSISSSQAKDLLYLGPAGFQRKRQEPSEGNENFDFGSVVHALVLGVGDFTVIDFPDYRTKAARAARDAVRATGAAPVIPRDLARAEAAAQAVREHPVAARLLSGGRPEVSVWATDPATGVLMRGRIDWLRGNVNTDVKTTSGSVDAEDFIHTVMRYHYGFQGAFYRKLLTLNGLDPGPIYWIPVTKKPPFEAAVLKPADDLIEFSMGEVDRALALYAQCLETGEWPELQDQDQPDYIAHARTVEAVPLEEVVPF